MSAAVDLDESIEKFCDLPYSAEYAKSNRATCKGCKQKIGEGYLRMSANEPSRFFDGVQSNWFHFSCFWKKLKKGDKINEASIRGMDWLKWDDQVSIREAIARLEADSKDARKSIAEEGVSFANFKAEHSRSNRGKCSSCKGNFKKSQVKLMQKGAFYHPLCIIPIDAKIKDSVSQVQNFDQLTDEGRDELRACWPHIKIEKQEQNEEEVTKKAVKKEDPETSSNENKLKRELPSTSGNDAVITLDDEDENEQKPAERPWKRFKPQQKSEEEIRLEKLKKQTECLLEMRELFTNLHRLHLEELLEANSQPIPKEEHKLLDRLADCAVFGRPIQCIKCPNGQIVYSTSKKTYVCLGYLTEYTKCTYTNQNPLRTPFQIPMSMIDKFEFLKQVKTNVLSRRVYPAEDQPIVGRSDSFKSLGARKSGRFNNQYAEELYYGEKKSISGHSGTTSNKQIIKNGTVVDNECEHAEVSHVYKDDEGALYTIVLSSADMSCNKNSYYKMQLLKHDTRNTYYVFRSWGRVGTDVGGKMTNSFLNVRDAVSEFERLFQEKTGNDWENRKYFKKRPGKMCMVETDYSELEKVEDEHVVPGSKTQLPTRVKDIILKIFDVNSMKQDLKLFELDLDQMPLGKLSKKQLQAAYAVLTELETLLEHPPQSSDASDLSDLLIDISNRFYTLVPHNFGMNPVEILNSKEQLQKKTKMIDSLMEIEITYNIINENRMNKVQLESGRDPVDLHYESIKCDLEPLDNTSVEYQQLKQYLDKSHGSTHGYRIELIDLLKVARHSERENFRADIGNRMLLWHGSQTTNFGGILSQGLRIAPPEAPVSGYMFGKGIYFADMASKSFNYCRLQGWYDEGLLLLCEVALGKQQLEYRATTHSKKSVEAKGCHSVKGLGREFPNDSGIYQHPDGYIIPMGHRSHAQDSEQKPFTLQYNEYIVYDTAQVNLRYLVRAKMVPR